MRFSWIYIVSGLCTTAYTYETQQVLGSLDLSGNSYKCENGVKPSITCTDSMAEKPNCSCTCTNGIIFDQLLPSTSQNGSDIPSGSCQVDKDKWLEREQELMAEIAKKEQENLNREQELKAQLNTCQDDHFTYTGCYTDPKRNLLKDYVLYNKEMTIGLCARICSRYQYYGVVNEACFCDNNYQAPTEKVSESRCEFKCPGNAGTKCGGTYTLGIYAKTI